MTSGSIEARLVGAIVDVLPASRARPAVDADAGKAAVGVGAGGAILADVRPDRALVDVLRAVGSGEVGRTGTRVGVDAVDAGASVLAQMTAAVVHVHLAVVSRESGRADALVGRRAVVRDALTSAQTRVHLTGNVA